MRTIPIRPRTPISDPSRKVAVRLRDRGPLGLAGHGLGLVEVSVHRRPRHTEHVGDPVREWEDRGLVGDDVRDAAHDGSGANEVATAVAAGAADVNP
jgi:hypothetical protein